MQKCQLPSGGESKKEKKKMHFFFVLSFFFFSFFFFSFSSICWNLSITPLPFVHIIDSQSLSLCASPTQKDQVHTEEAEEVEKDGETGGDEVDQDGQE